MSGPSLLVVDNYDSFTWNLVHLLGPLCGRIDVVRNDEVTAEGIFGQPPDAVVLSPGPCTPNEAGVCLALIHGAVAQGLPVLGVCLGHQALGQAFGGRVVRAPRPVHGKVGRVQHGGEGLFAGLPSPFSAARYHSLVVERTTCPHALAVTAWSEDGLVMGLSHREACLHGVQFHPESIASEGGETIMRNFLRLAAQARLRAQSPAQTVR